MPDQNVDDALEDLPPSSKFIYKTLADEGSMTLKGLTETTLLSSRTARYGLDQLEEADLIDSSPALHDGRQTCYRLKHGPDGSEPTDDEQTVVVSPEWVESRLSEFEADDPDLRLVEADSDEEYERGHLPGAVQIDVLEELVDVNGCGIADCQTFETCVGDRGITVDSTVVIYSTGHNQYAAYLYWLFKYYRHTDVRLLDGGKTHWERSDRPMTTDAPEVTPREYSAHPSDDRIRAYRTDVEAAIARDVRIVDVRSSSEFRGDQARPPDKDLPEARSAGRIPGTAHLMWSDVIDENGRFKDRAELEQLFHDRDVHPGTETIVYCHIGERSSIVWFILSELLEYDAVANYDGSWIEWGNLIDAPVESDTGN
ncbi:rhodanese-like domain-containing protein [Natrialbaceae archaeon AArc-T1-2]|uniref:rhodanese-like domain-containing protein n=1 Tax=Natrialbaceae archaeon AArc-T1-2 TaxID=3053904 RepID=UPI00255A9279|nr:rhodanese-like domain-containing protein [Natrialbaceae archaeon AArc-T1-2]WIV65685.1 rhodanese-like domain-containing protein [Natrialbaceae archaeon AArc-T1-2]